MSDSKSAAKLTRPIRVLRIISRMNVGGPAVQISGLMRGLDHNNFDHKLVTGHCDENESDYLVNVAKDVNATRIDGLGRSIKPIADIRALISVIRIIRKFRPDIVHTHTAKAGVIGRVASILSGHKSFRVHTFHGHLLHGYFSRSKTNSIILIEKLLGRFSSRLIAVGLKVQQDLIEAGIGDPEKFQVIPPGLQLKVIPSQREAKKSLGLDPDILYCSLIGRVTEIKRPDRFLEVVKELHRRNVKIKFIIAGSGNLLRDTSEKIRLENLDITCLGWRSDIEVVLAASDIVLLTSDNEGTPLSLIQAGMVGVPVVSTDVGSVSEIVLNGKTGLIRSLNIQDLADAVEWLVQDFDWRQSLGSAAKSYTHKSFSVGRLVSDHENLYRKLVTHPTNS